MNKFLLVLATPNHQSLDYYLAKTIQAALRKQQKEIKMLDLYADHFNPVLCYKKSPAQILDEDGSVYRSQKLIQWADKLIFVYPIWWSGMPAILKGWIDRNFAVGFAYHDENGHLTGNFKNKSAWIITTYDSPASVRAKLQDYGTVLEKQILNSCGIQPVEHDELASASSISLGERKKFINYIKEKAQKL